MNTLARIVHDLVTGHAAGEVEAIAALPGPERLALAELQAALLQPQEATTLQLQTPEEWASPPPPRTLAQS